MAGNLTADELARARAELARVNEAHGFKHNARDNGGPQDSPVPAESPAPEVQEPKAPADPGPPRFLGLDIEHRIAILSGGAGIPVDDGALEQMLDILLGQLKLHLSRTLGTIADTHKRPRDETQLEIPFPDRVAPA